MSNFKRIFIPRMLLDTLRSDLSVNKAGNLSVLYKICLSCLYPFQSIWDDFDNPNFDSIDPTIRKGIVTDLLNRGKLFSNRRILQLIANCKWQIGQLQNVLNYIFDPVNNSIVILQNNGITDVYGTNFSDTPTDIELPPLYAKNFDDSPSGLTPVYMPNFNSVFIETTQAQIQIPFTQISLEFSAINAIINMIRLKGTTYKLLTL
jgi:hypothetical protein